MTAISSETVPLRKNGYLLSTTEPDFWRSASACAVEAIPVVSFSYLQVRSWRLLTVTEWLEMEANRLLAACAEGEDGAWRELFRRFFPAARWIAAGPRFHMPDELAKDIAQQTMIDLCAAVMRRKVRNASGYVRAVAHNKCVDVLRRNEPLDNLSAPSTREHALDGNEIPPKIPLTRAEDDLFADLRDCLEDLGNPCSELLALRYFHGKSYKEVSSGASIPEAQVGMRLTRCLAKLRTHLEQRRPALREELAELLMSR